MQALDFAEQMKKELESMKEMIFSYVRASVRVMILEDPPRKQEKFSPKTQISSKNTSRKEKETSWQNIAE